MKLVRLPTKQDHDWWILVHELSLAEGRLRKLRLIHVFTHLAQTLVKTKKSPIFSYCFALENKLFGTRFHQFELRKAFAEVTDPIYRGKYVREYDDQQKVICVLEAYLSSIYSALEIASLINRILYPSLPIGFRKQSKKFEPFSFTKWNWLPYFYDIRSVLVHFGTPLPQIEKLNLLIDITHSRQLFVLEKGKNNIPISSILNYSVALFKLLDAWAEKELSKIDSNKKIDSIYETGLNSPLKVEKIKAKELLELIKRE